MPSKTDDRVKMIEELVTEAGRQRESWELEAATNVAMTLGYQWAQWHPHLRTLVVPRVPEHRVRITHNQIIWVVMTMLAKLTKSTPIWLGVPTTMSDEDINASKIVEKVMRYQKVQLRIKPKLVKTVLWALMAGHSFLKVFSDLSQGQLLQPATSNEPELRTGEVGVSVVSPFSLYYDFTVEDFNDVKWVCELKVVSKEWLTDTFGSKATAEDIDEKQDLNWFRRLMNVFYGKNAYEGNKDAVNGVLIKEFYKIPATPKQKALHTIVGRGKILHEVETNEYPYHDDAGNPELPYVYFGALPFVGRGTDLPPVTNLVPIQRAFNEERSAVSEAARIMAKLKYMSPFGAGLQAKSLDDEHGEVVEYNAAAGPAPYQVHLQNMPNYVFQSIDRLAADITNIGMVHETSRAQVPPGVTAASAIAYLQEQDDTRLGLVGQGVEQSYSELGRMVLRRTRQVWTEPRTIRLVGDDARAEVFDFYAAKFAGIDVTVLPGSAMPEMRVAKDQRAQDLWRLGLVQDPRVVLKMMQLGEVAAVLESYDKDTAWAKEENDLMSQGMYSEPREFENHAVHIFEHNQYRKGAEYRGLPRELQALFDQHVEATKAIALAQTQQAQAMMDQDMRSQALGSMMRPQQGQPTSARGGVSPITPMGPRPGGPQPGPGAPKL